MKAYKIYQQDKMGFEGNITYATNYHKAIQLFNNLIRSEIADVGEGIVDKDDFSSEVEKLRKNLSLHEIICRKYPAVICKSKENTLIGLVYYWENTSYEYNEYDINANPIKLEEIELVD